MEQQQDIARSERRGGILSRLPFRPSDAGPEESLEALLRLVKQRNYLENYVLPFLGEKVLSTELSPRRIRD